MSTGATVMLAESSHAIPAALATQGHLVHDGGWRQGLTLSFPFEVAVEADHITFLDLSPQPRPTLILARTAPDIELLSSPYVVKGEAEGVSESAVHTPLGFLVPTHSPAFHGSVFSTPLVVSVPEVVFP